MTARAAPALRALTRRPVLQDAALASALFVVCLLVNDPFTLVQVVTDPPVFGAWGAPDVLWVWWLATALAVVGVTLRRRWPVPMLILCTLSAMARLAVGILPTVVDLAVPILLYTVAARYPRIVSLSALGGLLLLGATWSIGDSLTGRAMPLMTFHTQLCDRDATASGPDRPGSVSMDCQGRGSSPWSGLLTLASGLIAVWAVGSGSRNRRAYLGQLHARASDLERERDQQAALAVAAERGRISRELHDVVAHGLSLIVVQAQGGEAALDNQPEATRRALQTIVGTGRDSLADMRRVLTALGEAEDTWHPQPGLAQLPGLLTRVRTAGTLVRLHVEGTPAALPSAVDLSAYRIVQEALTNVVKHAGSGARADVVIRYRDTQVEVEVSDDGLGTAAGGGGNGLPGMRRRVTLLGGRLTAEPAVQGGFVVQAALPVQGQHS
jgi:signal transduction histidine kinase